MTMNRIADLRYDRENPRTKQRALATGALSLQFGVVFHRGCSRPVFCGGLAVEPPCAETCAVGDRDSVFLLVHETLYDLVASFSWLRAGISPAAAWIAITGGSTRAC